MSRFRLLSSLTIILLINVSCGKSLPALDQVDLDVWKNDKLACQGKRISMSAAIQSQSEKLLALSEKEIIQLLGKPDENELYTRNQKFYYYYLEPSKACSDTVHSESRKLVVRFNATGLAREVSVEGGRE
jgi:hypothetical protein